MSVLFPCIDLPLGRGGGNGVLMWGVFLSQLKIQANFLNPVVYVIFSVCFCTSACTDKVFFFFFVSCLDWKNLLLFVYSRIPDTQVVHLKIPQCICNC